jgi:arylsulfatase A-like enzyme
MFAYEATLHVPLIVARVDPRATRPAAGVVIDAPVRHVDIVPTVLDLLGMPRDPALSGRSLRDVAAGASEDRPTYFESMTYNLVRGWAPLRGMLADRRRRVRRRTSRRCRARSIEDGRRPAA